MIYIDNNICYNITRVYFIIIQCGGVEIKKLEREQGEEKGE